MSFFLSETNEHVRLKSYDATIKGGKTTLRITVEVTDPYELSFLLRALEELQTAPKKPAPTTGSGHRSATDITPRNKLSQQVMLALPAPRRDTDH